MQLELDRNDLSIEHQEINCSSAKFQHFKPEVQLAIVAVGRALFRSRENHEAIYPPEEKSYFPLTIQLGTGLGMTVHSPDEIPKNTTFTIVKTH